MRKFDVYEGLNRIIREEVSEPLTNCERSDVITAVYERTKNFNIENDSDEFTTIVKQKLQEIVPEKMKSVPKADDVVSIKSTLEKLIDNNNDVEPFTGIKYLDQMICDDVTIIRLKDGVEEAYNFAANRFLTAMTSSKYTDDNIGVILVPAIEKDDTIPEVQIWSNAEWVKKTILTVISAFDKTSNYEIVKSDGATIIRKRGTYVELIIFDLHKEHTGFRDAIATFTMNGFKTLDSLFVGSMYENPLSKIMSNLEFIYGTDNLTSNFRNVLIGNCDAKIFLTGFCEITSNSQYAQYGYYDVSVCRDYNDGFGVFELNESRHVKYKNRRYVVSFKQRMLTSKKNIHFIAIDSGVRDNDIIAKDIILKISPSYTKEDVFDEFNIDAGRIEDIYNHATKAYEVFSHDLDFSNRVVNLAKDWISNDYASFRRKITNMIRVAHFNSSWSNNHINKIDIKQVARSILISTATQRVNTSLCRLNFAIIAYLAFIKLSIFIDSETFDQLCKSCNTTVYIEDILTDIVENHINATICKSVLDEIHMYEDLIVDFMTDDE